VEVARVEPLMKPVEELVASFPTGDAAQRLADLVGTMMPALLSDEALIRTGERVYLDTWLANQRDGNHTPVRAGRRMRYIDEALRPLGERLSEPGRQRLRCALALTLGTEALIAMKDSAGLDDDEEIVATLKMGSGRTPAYSAARLRRIAVRPVSPWPRGARHGTVRQPLPVEGLLACADEPERRAKIVGLRVGDRAAGHIDTPGRTSDGHAWPRRSASSRAPGRPSWPGARTRRRPISRAVRRPVRSPSVTRTSRLTWRRIVDGSRLVSRRVSRPRRSRRRSSLRGCCRS